ncbi:glucose dehydrogenase [FAD, quinone]-like [Schistocerca cancellata]|uniref:glucose dehydrogenase [FAD, quinone]-like n=1 Tax=Schistocerca cancellata TaxID=274614 RepID=UPI0021186757|nr:glucose dehydrogenase [FAD, quinone]-like [Schistocerca cancellata]
MSTRLFAVYDFVPCFATHAVGTSLDWNFTTTRQAHACLSTGGVCRWPRGKMVAGTGGMHGMMYTRGHRDCYDAWARAGNPGWGYDDVLPYFKRAERNLDPDQMEMEFHGAEGAMPVQQFPHRPAMAEVIVAALQSLGYRRGDLNGANQTGVAVAQMMVQDGLRASTPRVYLRPLHNCTRLRVAIRAHVTRVLIDPASRRALGVQYVDAAGATRRALARREVILSAGAIGSPQLLLLSGVGPSEHLTALGIKTVRDLPVGENLHNHVSAGLGFWVRSPGPGRRALNADTLDAFLRTRDGPMASTGLTQTTAFVLSQYAKDGVPDLQIFFDGFSARCSRTGEAGECESDACGPAYVYARPTAVRVQSRGRLRLRSADPRAPPLLDPRYLSRPRDLDVLVDGLRLVARAARTPPMRAWGVAVDDAPRPGCRHLPFASDEYWRCVVRVHTGPENHQAGTCKMGPSWDYTAVVDARLRVHGVAALRVVDASIFPEVPNGNPVAPIIMVAEKAADMIKEDWRRAHQH